MEEYFMRETVMKVKVFFFIICKTHIITYIILKCNTVLTTLSFWKIQKFLNLRKANYSPKIRKIPEGKSNGTEIPEKKFS